MSSHQKLIDKISNQLQEWDYELDRMEARLKDLSEDLTSRGEAKLQELKHKREDVKERLSKLEHAAEDAAEDFVDGLEIAWDGLKTGFYAAKSEFFGDKDDDKE